MAYFEDVNMTLSNIKKVKEFSETVGCNLNKAVMEKETKSGWNCGESLP